MISDLHVARQALYYVNCTLDELLLQRHSVG